jgi:threonine/homoserine/homoserine lactone efflux protein
MPVQVYAAVVMKFHPAIFGVVFCVFGIGSLLVALLKTQPWYVRYIQVALALTFIALGILIPLSLHRLGYEW